MSAPERSSRRTVEFVHPFVLSAGEDEMPAGSYDVETEEELIPGVSFVAYRRVRTTLTSPATQHGIALQRQVHVIDPSALEAALVRDREHGPVVAAPSAAVQPASAATNGQTLLARLRKHTLVSESPVIIPLLIVAGLALVTWYRSPN